jgi:hypothetical protein
MPSRDESPALLMYEIHRVTPHKHRATLRSQKRKPLYLYLMPSRDESPALRMYEIHRVTPHKHRATLRSKKENRYIFI